MDKLERVGFRLGNYVFDTFLFDDHTDAIFAIQFSKRNSFEASVQ